MSRLRNRARLALLLLLLVPIARAEHGSDDESRYEIDYSRTTTYSGGGVVIDHSFGDLVVRPHNAPNVSVKAKIRSSDPEIGRQIRIIGSEGSSGVHI